jgi:hypothetical protein
MEHPSIRKSGHLNLQTSGVRLVGILGSRRKVAEFVFCLRNKSMVRQGSLTVSNSVQWNEHQISLPDSIHL